MSQKKRDDHNLRRQGALALGAARGAVYAKNVTICPTQACTIPQIHNPAGVARPLTVAKFVNDSCLSRC
eukprot:scaffold60139_cov27-Phaeocystis_antarctica.AAC.1